MIHTDEDDEFARIEHENEMKSGQQYHWDVYVSPSQRNKVLEEVAVKLAALPFGDTAASFSCFVRALKEPV
jgi:hypothetical protein